jgi:hypothetical protein
MRPLVGILALRLVAASAGTLLNSLAELERNPHVVLGMVSLS